MGKDEISSALSRVHGYPLVKKGLSLIDFQFPETAPIRVGACFSPSCGDDKASLTVFNNAQKEDVIRAFGKGLVSLMDEDRKVRVKWFMTTVDPDWVSTIKLNWPDLHNFPTYDSLIEHHDAPVSKLCTIILCNTFIANGVSRSNSIGVDLTETASVKDFVNAKRYYPLFPLVTAYAPHLVDDFPEVLTDGCDDFKSVQHTELRKSLEKFLESVLS